MNVNTFKEWKCYIQSDAYRYIGTGGWVVTI